MPKNIELNLVEMAVEQDEKLMESYLNGEEIKEDDLVKCIRKGTLELSALSQLQPVLHFKNKGVQPLLDATNKLFTKSNRYWLY